MSYLIRTKYKKVQDPLRKFVGGYVPLRINSCLTIYSMVHDKSKHLLMEEALLHWMQTFYTPEIEEKCYLNLSKMLYSNFLALQVTRRSLSYSIFINGIRKDLEYKGLNIPEIKKILSGIDKEHFEATKN